MITVFKSFLVFGLLQQKETVHEILKDLKLFSLVTSTLVSCQYFLYLRVLFLINQSQSLEYISF